MPRVTNPILPGCYPDPSICRVGEEFFLVCSSFEYFPGLPIFRSRDLAHWDQIGHVIDRAGMLDFTGIASSGGLYAPTIRHHQGTFWVICTLVDQGSPITHAPGRGNFIVTATDAAGPWSDPVFLDVDGCDPSLFFDDDGRVWAHANRLIPADRAAWHDQCEVWLRELDPQAMQLTGPEYVIWDGAVRGGVWTEAPHIYQRDGTYYLLTAEGGTEIHHAVVVARSQSVTGPYEGNKANPILTHRHLGQGQSIIGVGHADLVEAPDGSWWAVLLGMRPYGGYHYNLGRETFLVPVTWEDGWPVLAPGVGKVTCSVEVPFASIVAGKTPGTMSAEPCGTALDPGDLRWTTLREPWDTFARRDGSAWVLATSPVGTRDVGTPAFLGVRQCDRDVDVTAEFTFSGLLRGNAVGLLVRQSEKDFAAISLRPPQDKESRGPFSVVVDHAQGGVTAEVNNQGLPGTEYAEISRITLALQVRGQDYTFGVMGEDGRDGRGDGGNAELGEYGDGGRAELGEVGAFVPLHTVDGRTLDTVATGGFLGLWIGAIAIRDSPSDPPCEVRLEKFTYAPVE
ncbi:MAG: glycoside hydrolase family 43 protein [Cellulomonadaceae bacterium]|jgi:alpha-N-arabinofuranosidase|nr:glycoside hydrolase family 43 protein [Cellulomonadaceae bacterium]